MNGYVKLKRGPVIAACIATIADLAAEARKSHAECMMICKGVVPAGHEQFMKDLEAGVTPATKDLEEVLVAARLSTEYLYVSARVAVLLRRALEQRALMDAPQTLGSPA